MARTVVKLKLRSLFPTAHESNHPTRLRLFHQFLFGLYLSACFRVIIIDLVFYDTHKISKEINLKILVGFLPPRSFIKAKKNLEKT